MIHASRKRKRARFAKSWFLKANESVIARRGIEHLFRFPSNPFSSKRAIPQPRYIPTPILYETLLSSHPDQNRCSRTSVLGNIFVRVVQVGTHRATRMKSLFGVWPLLLGILLIMLGNGMHFTLMGLRGGIEGFSSTELALVTSGYFLGFLSGAHTAPHMIRRVGHVRVFAALGSFMSAGLISFPLLTTAAAWVVLRVLIGFCMSGIYVTAESWLNDAATNETRGGILSAYMVAQTLGIIGAQGILALGDAGTSVLFIGASILVSVSFAPILLTVVHVPAAEVGSSMPVRELFRQAPLCTVGIFLLGSVYATQSGMGAVFGSSIGLSPGQISLFVSMLFAGALVMQVPIGWLSDRVDRRKLILFLSASGAVACGFGWLTPGGVWTLMTAAFFAGGVTTPLYALFLAYANDSLANEKMAAASGGLVLIFGLGAILGPLLAGAAMQRAGPMFFWPVLGVTFALTAFYVMYRMTQRESIPVEETEPYLGVVPTATPVAVEAAGTWAAEQAELEQDEGTPLKIADVNADALLPKNGMKTEGECKANACQAAGMGPAYPLVREGRVIFSMPFSRYSARGLSSQDWRMSWAASWSRSCLRRPALAPPSRMRRSASALVMRSS